MNVTWIFWRTTRGRRDFLQCVGSSRRCSSATASGCRRGIEPTVLVSRWRRGGTWWKGTAEAGQREPTRALRKHARYRQTAAAPRFGSLAAEHAYFAVTAKHCGDETEGRRGRLWIPAYIDLRHFLWREDSCFSTQIPVCIFRCFFRGAARKEVPPVMRGRILRLWLIYWFFFNLRKNRKTLPKAFDITFFSRLRKKSWTNLFTKILQHLHCASTKLGLSLKTRATKNKLVFS